ncbi:MAG TPA: hypothetical protein VM121_11800 [Acidimicrobiales bacterium]|nr:hypothetical protein [Acidimicrobiales bacterium]
MGLALLILLALAGTVTMLVVTQHGPYVSPDAVSYVGTARGLAAGDGVTTPPGTPPVGHFAPLYPVTLAALDVVGLDPVDGARWLNALLLGATVLVVGLVLRRATQQWWPGLVGGALVVLATDALTYHASALSDPMFVLLCILALAALAEYLHHRRPLMLAAVTALTALVLLTRYVGIALVATGLILLMLYGAGGRWRGAPQAGAFAIAAVVPVGAWVLWARSAHGRGSEGEIVWHPFGGSDLQRGAENLVGWFVPDSLPWWLGIVMVAGAIALFVRAARSTRRDEEQKLDGVPGRLPVVCAVFAGAYVAVLLLDRLFIDASALLDRRLLLPLHVVVIVGVLAMACREAIRGPIKAVAIGVLGLLFVFQIAEATTWVRDSVDDAGARRGGYTSSVWRQSPVVATVRTLPPEVPVYTNGPDAIWFLTGRATKELPPEKDYLTGKPNPHYRAELAEMTERVRAGQGRVVYFSVIKSRPYLPTVDELRQVMPLHEVSSDQIGTLYGG